MSDRSTDRSAFSSESRAGSVGRLNKNNYQSPDFFDFDDPRKSTPYVQLKNGWAGLKNASGEKLVSLSDLPSGTSYPFKYDSTYSYEEGDQCFYLGITYKKRTGSGTESGKQPNTNPASWAAISGGNTDWSSVSSDIALEKGETIELPFSSATSVPLHIATGDGTAYELTLHKEIDFTASGSSAYAMFLQPNNADYASAFYSAGIYNGSTAASSTPSAFAVTAAQVRIGLDYEDVVTKIFNKTTSKAFISNGVVNYSSTAFAAPYSVMCSWKDKTTVYLSLGTLIFHNSWSGYALVKRIA